MNDPFHACSSETKACPFCGGSKVTVYQGENFRWRVAICDECGAQAPDVRHTVGEGKTSEQAMAETNKRAIDAWNERT